MASIELKSVIVDFPVYGANARSVKNSLLRISTGGKLGADNNIISVRALDNVSFRLEHGDRLGIIGHNGSGKSTLLRVLAGIYEPTSGWCYVEGKVSALLDVMLGMDPESTGYENILLRGIIMGLTREEIESKKDEIAAFTDLGGYLALPVRAYSTGMQLRLAFGIATAILPEILVLDEIVGTGDAAFMDKAQTRFSSIVEASHILVLASHDLNIIEKLCTKVLWLNAGQIAFMGDCQDGVALYKQHR